MIKGLMRRLIYMGLVGILVLSGCGVVKVVKSDQKGALGFEGGEAGEMPEDWVMDSPLHTLDLDPEVKHSGRFSARLTNADPGSSGREDYAYAKHCAIFPEYRGMVLRVSGFLKVEGGMGRMVASRTQYPESDPTGTIHSPEVGPQDWSKYELVTNNLLPPARRQGAKDSPEFCIYFELRGVGTVWADDFSIEKIDLSGLKSEAIQPIPLPNLDMESVDRRGGPNNWTLEESTATLKVDNKVKHSGANSAHLSFPFSPGSDVGVSPIIARYCGDPGLFVGRVVRVGAWIKGDQDARGLSPNMALVAQWPDASRSVFVLRNLDDTTNWTHEELVASVPLGSARVCFGFGGSGVWGDDFSVEALAL